MPESASPVLFAGVDGGGTGCRVRLCDDGGTILAQAEGPSANVYLDRDGSLCSIRATVARAFAIAGLDTSLYPRLHLGLGLAGVSDRKVAREIAEELHDYGAAFVENDALIACIGAHAGADGGLVIVGTGSAALLRLNGMVTTVGGRGFLLGDDGSGAIIGRSAMRKALRAWDGLDASSPFLRSLLHDFGDDPVALIHWSREAKSSDFARFAPAVFEAATVGDPAGLFLVAEAAAAIDELVETLRNRGAPRISMVGGLAPSIGQHLKGGNRLALSPPLGDSLAGALVLAGAPSSIDG